MKKKVFINLPYEESKFLLTYIDDLICYLKDMVDCDKDIIKDLKFFTKIRTNLLFGIQIYNNES